MSDLNSPPADDPVSWESVAANRAFLSSIRGRLSSYVRQRFSARHEECDDLVSEIIAVLIYSLRSGTFRGGDLKSLNAYIYGIARLKIMKAVERAGRRHELSQHLRSSDLCIARFTSPEMRTIRTDLLERIYGGLDPKCSELMRLKFAEGWTDQELADYKKMTKNALSTAISRCLQKARTLKPITEILYQNRH